MLSPWLYGIRVFVLWIVVIEAHIINGKSKFIKEGDVFIVRITPATS